MARNLEEEGGPGPEARPKRGELRGGMVGGNVVGGIFLSGAIEFRDADCADFPRSSFCTAVLAGPGVVLLNLP